MSYERDQRFADAQRADLALLAVVPYQHLLSGIDTQKQAGRVAYGTGNATAISELDFELKGEPCFVLIYPSEAPYNGPPKARWRAIYVRQTPGKNGRHPQQETFRPRSTASDGHWETFWEVADLEELTEADAVPMSKLRARKKKANLSASFIPKGPLLIDNPF